MRRARAERFERARRSCCGRSRAVLARRFEQVVGDEATGASASTFFVSVLRPMRCCSRAKGAGRAVAPDQDLAVEHGAVGQRVERGQHIRESARSPAPRRATRSTPARSRCTSCARMPSYFHSTSQSSAARVARESAAESQRMREEERVGLAARIAARRGATSARKRPRSAAPCVGVAHHPLRDELGVESRVLGQRALHQQLLTPTRKPPPISLMSRKRSPPSSSSAQSQPRQHVGRRLAAQRQQALLDPLGQAGALAVGGGSTGRWSRPGRRPPGSTPRTASPAVRWRRWRLPQRARADRLARLAAGEEVHRPGGVAVAACAR